MKNKIFENYVSIAKDIVVLSRDSALILLAILLFAFPVKFNHMLVEAGFKEGNLLGFKWKTNLEDSNSALKKANLVLDSLQLKNGQLILALQDVEKKLNDTELKEKLKNLETQNTKIQQNAKKVQTNVLNVIDENIPLIQGRKALSKSEEIKIPDYSVGLQTLGISDKNRIIINEKINQKGYKIDDFTYAYKKNKKPSWFASESTVFYYSSSSKKQAKDLAIYMQSLTGVKFKTLRGAGLGVDPSKKHLTIFIHYLK